MKSADAALQLGDDVFLITTVVGFSDDLLLREAAIVGDVEEVAEVSADAELATLFLDELAQHGDAVGLLRSGGTVLELGRIFGNEPLVEVTRSRMISSLTRGCVARLAPKSWSARRTSSS